MIRMTNHLRHVHASGCARATAGEWYNALSYWAEAADVITITEAGGFHGLLRRWRAEYGFNLAHSTERGKAETAVLVRAEYGYLPEVRYKRLTGLRLRTARKAPLYAVKVLVVTNNDHRTWITAAHLPAHVEGKFGLIRGWASGVYRAAALGWSEMRFGSEGRIISADWNLNHRRPWVRAYLRSLFPGTKPGWDFRNLPSKGTLRGSRRLIDGPRANLEVVTPSRILEPMPGFDHLAVRTVYRTKASQ